MKCSRCGFENREAINFCSNCGEKLEKKISITTEINLNPAIDVVMPALKDKLFLVLCILVSVSTFFSLVSGGGIPIIETLLTVFLWLLYSQKCKNNLNHERLKNISGTVYANYVLTNIGAIMIIILSGLLGLCILLISGEPSLKEALYTELANSMNENNEYIYTILVKFILSSYIWILVAMFAFAGVISLFINIAGMKRIHTFIKSVYLSLENETLDFKEVKSAKSWLIVFGVIYIFSALSTLINGQIIAFLSEGCNIAALFITAKLISKHFIEKE